MTSSSIFNLRSTSLWIPKGIFFPRSEGCFLRLWYL
jgi:hypothetical protein